jgi:hypothetical protein
VTEPGYKGNGITAIASRSPLLHFILIANSAAGTAFMPFLAIVDIGLHLVRLNITFTTAANSLTWFSVDEAAAIKTLKVYAHFF